MKVELQSKCTATHEWVSMAQFSLASLAADAAMHLSVSLGNPFRIIDRRWPEDGELVTVYENGKPVA